MSDTAEKLTDCRICIQRDEPHSYEHDFVTLRNAISGSVYRDEGSAAHDRAHATVKQLREQVARLEAERTEIADLVAAADLRGLVGVRKDDIRAILARKGER